MKKNRRKTYTTAFKVKIALEAIKGQRRRERDTQGEESLRTELYQLWLMGLEAIYPKPRLSLAAPGHQIYPHLLRGVKVTRINQVWSADITYIRLLGGYTAEQQENTALARSCQRPRHYPLWAFAKGLSLSSDTGEPSGFPGNFDCPQLLAQGQRLESLDQQG